MNGKYNVDIGSSNDDSEEINEKEGIAPMADNVQTVTLETEDKVTPLGNSAFSMLRIESMSPKSIASNGSNSMSINSIRNNNINININNNNNSQQFGQMLNDSKIGSDLVMDDILDDINNGDKHVSGVSTDKGNDNRNNKNDNNYVTPGGGFPHDQLAPEQVGKQIPRQTAGAGGEISNKPSISLANQSQQGEMDVEIASQDDIVHTIAGHKISHDSYVNSNNTNNSDVLQYTIG